MAATTSGSSGTTWTRSRARTGRSTTGAPSSRSASAPVPTAGADNVIMVPGGESGETRHSPLSPPGTYGLHMTQQALLNNVHHKDLRIITQHAARYGDDIMGAPTFPGEFRNIQAHYPIVFHRTDAGEFVPLALFGFREKQNLFLGA